MERYRNILRLAIISIVLLLFGGLGFMIYQSAHFRLVGTVPTMDAVPKEIREFDFNYNRELSDQALSVSSSPSIITSKKVDGKKLILNTSGLSDNTTYTITIESIKSKDGSVITGKNFSFIARTIAFGDLPDGTQKLLLNQQQAGKGIYGFDFGGFNSLTSYGLSAKQLDNLRNIVYEYSQSLKPPVNGVAVDTKSIALEPHDPSSTDFATGFKINIAGTDYKARVVYSGTSDGVRLYLYDYNSNQQLFDSNSLESD